MQGFRLTGVEDDGVGGDLDVDTPAADSDEIILYAIVLVVRTRRGAWYYNPSRGLDRETANWSPRDQDIKQTIEADLTTELSTVTGFSLDSVSAERVGTSRVWSIKIVGRVSGRTVRTVTFNIPTTL